MKPFTGNGFDGLQFFKLHRPATLLPLPPTGNIDKSSVTLID